MIARVHDWWSNAIVSLRRPQSAHININVNGCYLLILFSVVSRCNVWEKKIKGKYLLMNLHWFMRFHNWFSHHTFCCVVRPSSLRWIPVVHTAHGAHSTTDIIYHLFIHIGPITWIILSRRVTVCWHSRINNAAKVGWNFGEISDPSAQHIQIKHEASRACWIIASNSHSKIC